LDAGEDVLDERAVKASTTRPERSAVTSRASDCEGRAAARAAVEMAADAQAAHAVQLAVETVGKSLRRRRAARLE
jgi:hypothetical protein